MSNLNGTAGVDIRCRDLGFSKNLNRLSSKIYANVIDAYAQKGLWSEAEYVFGCEREKDVTEYNVMIKAYGIAKLYDKVFLLFKVKVEFPQVAGFFSYLQWLATFGGYVL
ncbi:pentatricopeptide repeat-containing protein [Tanacetum coccineum]